MHFPILIAEDSKFQSLVLRNHLETLGYEVLSAIDGRQALELFEKYQPRILITDMEMPLMNGIDLIKAVRERQMSYTHITVLSSLDSKDVVIQAIAAGADDYLIKPFHPTEMSLRLEAAERMVRAQSQEKIILLMAKLTDYRSPETGFHIERVQYYTRLIAQTLMEEGLTSLNPRVVATMFTVSCLHDIGKIAIPDDVLKKPGKLTPEEFTLMKTHATIGGKILEEAYKEVGSELLHYAKDMTLYHHEKYDGTGYPKGLMGDTIPLSARILALADVFDALSSERVYKPAFDRETCHKIITEESGKHFDPRIVGVFEKKEDEFWKIHDKYADTSS
ncbi:MAG: response regulator [Spirochaetales bacterium]|nr:response regulator [Spirochaetales bacterium]